MTNAIDELRGDTSRPYKSVQATIFGCQSSIWSAAVERRDTTQYVLHCRTLVWAYHDVFSINGLRCVRVGASLLDFIHHLSIWVWWLHPSSYWALLAARSPECFLTNILIHISWISFADFISSFFTVFIRLLPFVRQIDTHFR